MRKYLRRFGLHLRCLRYEVSYCFDWLFKFFLFLSFTLVCLFYFSFSADIFYAGVSLGSYCSCFFLSFVFPFPFRLRVFVLLFLEFITFGVILLFKLFMGGA